MRMIVIALAKYHQAITIFIAVASYVLKGKFLFVFYEVEGATTTCVTFKEIEPDQITATLDEKLGFKFNAMCCVMSARKGFSPLIPRAKPDHGLRMSLYCEVNTMPKIPADQPPPIDRD